VQGGLIRLTIPKFGQKKSVYIGLILYAIGFVLFGIAYESWMMFAFTIVYTLGGIAGPALQGIMSNEVPATEQGELQGGLTSLISLTSIIGPVMMTSIFAYFTDTNQFGVYFPGAPFILGALLTFISLGFAMRALKNFSG
ncbi:MAG: MFS transporter, partial [Bacteroidota bacterium]